MIEGPKRVKRIVTFDGDLDEASAGQSVTLWMILSVPG